MDAASSAALLMIDMDLLLLFCTLFFFWGGGQNTDDKPFSCCYVMLVITMAYVLIYLGFSRCVSDADICRPLNFIGPAGADDAARRVGSTLILLSFLDDIETY